MLLHRLIQHICIQTLFVIAKFCPVLLQLYIPIKPAVCTIITCIPPSGCGNIAHAVIQPWKIRCSEVCSIELGSLCMCLISTIVLGFTSGFNWSSFWEPSDTQPLIIFWYLPYNKGCEKNLAQKLKCVVGVRLNRLRFGSSSCFIWTTYTSFERSWWVEFKHVSFKSSLGRCVTLRNVI